MHTKTTGRKGAGKRQNGWVRLIAQNLQLSLGLTESETQPVRPGNRQSPHVEGLLPGGGAWGAGLPHLVFRGWRIRVKGILGNPSAGATVWNILKDSDPASPPGKGMKQRGRKYSTGDLFGS